MLVAPPVPLVVVAPVVLELALVLPVALLVATLVVVELCVPVVFVVPLAVDVLDTVVEVTVEPAAPAGDSPEFAVHPKSKVTKQRARLE